MNRPNLRELNKRRTEQEITRAALELFLDHGYESTSMDDIARRAEVGLRTVYRYFPSKLDIVTPGRTALREALAALPEQGAPSDFPDALTAPLHQIARWLDGLAERDAALISLASRDPLIRSALTAVIDDMTDLVARHLYAINRPLEPSTAHQVAAMAVAGMFVEFESDSNPSFTAAATRAVHLLTFGVNADPVR